MSTPEQEVIRGEYGRPEIDFDLSQRGFRATDMARDGNVVRIGFDLDEVGWHYNVQVAATRDEGIYVDGAAFHRAVEAAVRDYIKAKAAAANKLAAQNG